MNTKIIYEAVYNLLILANTRLNRDVYEKLYLFNSKNRAQILKNARLAYETQRPLCQDTGQIVVFLEIGQNINLEGEFIYDVINSAAADCYKDNFYRKSIVKDAILDRENTKNNTPCVIHTKFIKEDEISILIGIKGGGAENMTKLKMMNPTASIGEIYDFVRQTVKEAGENACPPISVGIGAGGTAETAAINAKYAIFKGKPVDLFLDNVFEVKMVSSPTHIASLPVCVNINCHSLRHFECKIKDEQIYYNFNDYIPEKIEDKMEGRRINADDIKTLKSLKTGELILLSGKIYTARDMAHKRLVHDIKTGQIPPINLKNAVLFYAGPCPKNKKEIIGPIGPTTSKRMDEFAPVLYQYGVIATIGKGKRTIKGGYIYLKAIGGIACLYKECVKSAKAAAYEDLGAEAVYELEVVDMPLEVEII